MLYLIAIGLFASRWFVLTTAAKCKTSVCNHFEQERWNNVDIKIRYKEAVITIPPHTEGYLQNTLRLPVVSLRDSVLPYNTPKQNIEGLTYSSPAIFRVTADDISNAGCSTNFSTQTKKILKKARCSPRPLLINIVTEEAQVKPSYILTKQCTGYCDEKRICEARKTVNKTIPVQVIPYSNMDQKLLCRTVSVPEDTRCKCVCVVKKQQCTAQQTYNKSFCSCDCTNKKEREHCEKKSRMTDLHTWDDQSCSCVCRKQIPCTTGTYWDSRLCRCSKNVENKG